VLSESDHENHDAERDEQVLGHYQSTDRLAALSLNRLKTSVAVTTSAVVLVIVQAFEKVGFLPISVPSI